MRKWFPCRYVRVDHPADRFAIPLPPTQGKLGLLVYPGQLWENRTNMSRNSIVFAGLFLCLTSYAPAATQAGNKPSAAAMDRDLRKLPFHGSKPYIWSTATPSCRSLSGISIGSLAMTVSAPFCMSVRRCTGCRDRRCGCRKNSAGFKRGPLWGVPIVVKANTSVKGLCERWLARLSASGMRTDRAGRKRHHKTPGRGGGHSRPDQRIPDFAASDTSFSSAGGRTGNA